MSDDPELGEIERARQRLLETLGSDFASPEYQRALEWLDLHGLARLAKARDELWEWLQRQAGGGGSGAGAPPKAPASRSVVVMLGGGDRPRTRPLTDSELKAVKATLKAMVDPTPEAGKAPGDGAGEPGDEKDEGEGETGEGEPGTTGGGGKTTASSKKRWKPFRRARRLSWGPIGRGTKDKFNWRDSWVDDWLSPNRTIRPWHMPFSGDLFKPYRAQNRTNRWMSMEVETPPLKTPKWAKGAGCADAGSVFRAPWRLTTDQRVFRMNRAKRQGSVLLDTSGSMGIDEATIEKIVRAVPAAVIGMYAAAGNHGQLRILSKWGKLVPDSKYFKKFGGMNGVDGPALRWLGYQPFPRIWISDGMVTGVGDGGATNLLLEAEEICERYRIVRVHSLAEAQKLL